MVRMLRAKRPVGWLYSSGRPDGPELSGGCLMRWLGILNSDIFWGGWRGLSVENIPLRSAITIFILASSVLTIYQARYFTAPQVQPRLHRFHQYFQRQQQKIFPQQHKQPKCS